MNEILSCTSGGAINCKAVILPAPGLSGWAIAGIVIGAIIVLAVATRLVPRWLRLRGTA